MHGKEVLQMRIPCASQYIALARHAVDAVGEQLQLSQEARRAVMLAVGEACDNAVRHAGPPKAKAGSVLVVCRAAEDVLEIEITNPGSSFAPASPASMPPAEDLAERGRGRALMEQLMDSVQYLSRHGSTIVRLRKQRSPANGSGVPSSHACG